MRHVPKNAPAVLSFERDFSFGGLQGVTMLPYDSAFDAFKEAVKLNKADRYAVLHVNVWLVGDFQIAEIEQVYTAWLADAVASKPPS